MSQEMDEKALIALLREALDLTDEEARRQWWNNLPPDIRALLLSKVEAYMDAAFSAAADYLWAAQNVFEPMSRGEAPPEPLPKVHLPFGPADRHDESAAAQPTQPADEDEDTSADAS